MNEKSEAPKFEMVGPTVDDDVKRLIRRYGKEELLQAVKRETAAKRGRKPEKDWPLLKPYIQADAADWLEGRDPIQLRSHYSIAQEFAKEHPGHNQTATATRIMRKLSDKRRWMSLATAWQRSEKDCPYAVHLRILEMLADVEEFHVGILGFSRDDLTRYRERVGVPSPEMSMSEIREAAQAALKSTNALAGLASFGTLGEILSARPKA